MQQKHSSEETAPSTPEHSNTCDSPSSTSTSEPNEETDQLNLFFHTDSQDPFYNNNFMDMDTKVETMEADGFTTPIQSPSPPDTSSALSEQYKYATESISSEQQKSQQEAAFIDDSPNIDLSVQFNDILVQPHQPPATGPGEAASSGLWSGFNNFFSNVATNPFPQAIPNLAKNFTEYLSHYPQNLSNSLPTLGASNSAPNASGSGSANENSSFDTNSQLMMDGQSTDSQKLQIRVLGVPETGAKSRVETQIKLCMQLVTDKGEKVPLWSHLKLPEHMVARDKLKRSALMAAASGDGNNKIAITAMDGSILSLNSSKLLHLDAKVICASDPSRKVKTCFGCIQRERRRSQRKKENKNKPDAEDTLDQSNLAFEESRVLLFNCSEIVDFSSGDTILPTRITCYCRHHDEKVGFRILFAMKDYNGNEIATGMSPPIMITDDHKSSKVKTGRKRPRTEYEHPVAPDVSALMRDTESPPMSNIAMSRSPTTPALSPATEHAPNHYGMYNNIAPAIQKQHSSLALNNLQKPTLLPTSTPSPKTEQLNVMNTHHIKQEREHGFFPNFNQDFNIGDSQITVSGAAPNQNKSPISSMDGLQMLQNQRPANHLLSPPPESRNQNRSAPRLHRLIPNEGPTYGGIEVTVLGSGFHDGLTCMFGDSPAIPTHCWSPNTLVCILPPSTTSGTVVVSFKEHPLVVEGQDVVLFTYFNESDRALMELALQVVGLKMTGKVEDAREIAMRIVQGGSAGGSSNLQSTANQQQHQQQQHTAAMSNASESNQVLDLERQIIQVLDVMDTFDNGRKADLTLRNRSAQSMLHLASMLGYTKLTRALLDLGCPTDALDRNGYTALHYASWLGHSAVVKLLLEHANADPNIRNTSGSTPLDLASESCTAQSCTYNRSPSCNTPQSSEWHMLPMYMLQSE
ncbi:SPT3 Dosage dependent suppressor of Ty-induced promoter mutations-like protein [Umbelopsis sp. WA50703]